MMDKKEINRIFSTYKTVEMLNFNDIEKLIIDVFNEKENWANRYAALFTYAKDRGFLSGRTLATTFRRWAKEIK